jgi:PAS domain S-box-containing protein
MTRYRPTGPSRPALDPVDGYPLRLRLSGLALLVLAVALVVVAFGKAVYAAKLETAAIVAVILVQAATNLFYVRTWIVGRRNLDAVENEFDSIYLNVLDGILILDDACRILDANRAAFSLLGAPQSALVGESFRQFVAEPQRFERRWREFLEQSLARGRIELVRADRAKRVVNYTLTANHRPGRHSLVLCDITERVAAQDSARETQISYQQMADSIDEIYWLLDAQSKKVLAVNRAYETVTGRSLESIPRDPESSADLIHAADRARVLAKLEEAVHSRSFEEEFRIVRPDGGIRWVWVKGAPVPTPDNVIRQLYGTAQDITAKKIAEAQVAEHLAAAEAARAIAEQSSAEAEAMRKATLTLTQDLRMDCVLDTLLQTLHSIVPYDMASVLLTEEGDRLFVAREAPLPTENRPVLILEIQDSLFLQRVIFQNRTLSLPDMRKEKDWKEHKAFAGVRSWIAVPLTVSNEVQGLLSIGSKLPAAFTDQHLRMAKLLAVSAAVAIHNARLYEWAQIYSEERKHLLQKIEEKPKPAVESKTTRNLLN